MQKLSVDVTHITCSSASTLGPHATGTVRVLTHSLQGHSFQLWIQVQAADYKSFLQAVCEDSNNAYIKRTGTCTGDLLNHSVFTCQAPAHILGISWLSAASGQEGCFLFFESSQS